MDKQQTKSVKTFQILDKGKFWFGLIILCSGPVIIITLMIIGTTELSIIELILLGALSAFNTVHGSLRLSDKNVFKVETIQVPLTESEKLKNILKDV